MINSAINLITSQKSPDQDGFYIVSDKLISVLDGVEEEVSIDLTNYGRPIKLSEFSNFLTNRDWNIGVRKYINPLTQQLCVRYDKGIAPIDVCTREGIINNTIGNAITDLTPIPTDKIEEFEQKYSDILTDMNKNELYLYKSSNLVIDLLLDSVTLNLISEDSNIITDSINFQELLISIPVSNNKVKALVEIDIEYSISSLIYNYHTKIDLIDYNFEVPQRLNKVENVENQVSIELVNGILKILPISTDVTECIIKNCTLNYGNFS